MANSNVTARLIRVPASQRRQPGHRHDQVAVWVLRCLVHEELALRCAELPYIDSLLNDCGASLRTRLTSIGRAREARRVATAELERLADAGPPEREHIVFGNVKQLAATLKLDDTAAELLVLATLATTRHSLRECIGMCAELAGGHYPRFHALLAWIIGHDAARVSAALDPQAPLTRSGLMVVSMRRAREGELALNVTGPIADVLTRDHADAATLIGMLVEPSPAPELSLAEYDYMPTDVRLVRGYLAKALQQKIVGVNVLIHGLPGTGKSQFCRAIARDLGGSLFQVRVGDDEGEGLSRRDRMASFLLSQALLRECSGALVLFDEVEDAFADAAASRTAALSKGWVNRLLEENPVPAFWLTNNVGQIDAAFVRRFDVVVEMRVPPKRVRRRILGKHLNGLALSARWLDGCAEDAGITPADVSRAAKVMRTLQPDDGAATEEGLDRLLASQMLVRRGPAPPKYRPGSSVYDLDYLNTDCDIRALADAMGKRSRGTALLWGPPGTGKTAFAVWLAESLDRPLVHKRASDLLGKYVGETEARIAAMFREATLEQGVLLLDEADSFLRDRRVAERSWEVSIVNELLVQMEAFGGVFLCSTNLLDQIDPAAFRRFAFKIRFDVLEADQRLRLLLATIQELGVTSPEDAAAASVALAGLAIGDFAAITKRYQLLGAQPTLTELAEALRGELAFRSPVRRSAGFLA